MDEPLIRAGNISSAVIAGGLYLIGYPRVAMAVGALGVLDIVGRQVSPEYRDFVTHQPKGFSRYVAGLGLAGNLLGIDPPGVRRWEYKGPGVPFIRSLRGT